MMELRIVNKVWRGRMNRVVDLNQTLGLLATAAWYGQASPTHLKHQTTQPEQLIIGFDDSSTMLLFKSGKFRIMGGGVDDLDMHFNIIHVTLLYDIIPDIVLQTMTATCQYPTRINLNKLSECIHSQYSPEIFPAV